MFSVKVRNTGKRAGAEVVELYMHDGHSKIDRPVRELKGFQRVELKPGESKTITFSLIVRHFRTGTRRRRLGRRSRENSKFRSGISSRDIRLRAPFELKQ